MQLQALSHWVFLIDGKRGTISPIPERLDKVLKAFAWLARRPKVDGRSIERLLGHAIHMCLLRRELLSIFRALYDFVYSSYHHRQKLWASAAKEARWCSHLLRLCTIDIRRGWSGEVTCSDASLSGIAVCKRSLSADVQRKFGLVKENWRYKSSIPTKPRDSAFSALDPFSDPETVKPLNPVEKKPDPFELDVNFEEIQEDILDSSEWHECFAVHMQYPEHITLLEMRGIVAALRHKLRSVSEFGRAHLHFSDNMAATLLCSKGRSGNYGMLSAARRLACLLLASDSLLAVRWVPSERNVADLPSRRWEHLRCEHAATRSQQQKKKQAILQACYPNHETYGLRCAASPSRTTTNHRWQKEAKASRTRGFSENNGGEAAQESQKGCRTRRRSPFSGTDSAGENGSFKTSGHRLHEADRRAAGLCKTAEPPTESERQIRHGLLLVCEQHVRARVRLPRRVKDPSCHRRCIPRLRPQAHAGTYSKSSTRVAEGRTATHKTANSLGSDSHHVFGDDAGWKTGCSLECATDVHSIPPSWRSLGPSTKRPSATSSRKHAFFTTAPPSNPRSAVKGRPVRRVDHVGLSSFAVAGTSAAGACQARDFSAGHQLSPVEQGLEMGAAKGGASRRALCPVPVASLRPKFRPTPETSICAGSEATWEMGGRSQPQEIRGTCENSAGIPQLAQKRPGALHKARGQVCQGGTNFFPPKKSAQPTLK